MSNGGGSMGIPGLDPDGLSPGGFTLAGKADVGALAVLGKSVSPDVFGWGSWSNPDGVTITQNGTADIPFENEDNSFSDVAFVSLQDYLTILTAGSYLVFGETYNNDALVSGHFNINITNDLGRNYRFGGKWNVVEGTVSGLQSWLLVDAPVGTKIRLNVGNATDGDKNFGGDLAIIRLF